MKLTPEIKNNTPISLQWRRITNAEMACKRADSDDWAKNYWFNVFKKLCKMYGQLDYFRKQIH